MFQEKLNEQGRCRYNQCDAVENQRVHGLQHRLWELKTSSMAALYIVGAQVCAIELEIVFV